MTHEYFDSEEQMFWEGHLIRIPSQDAARDYSAKYGRDTGYCSACGTWVDRDAHFDGDGQCLLTCDRRPRQ